MAVANTVNYRITKQINVNSVVLPFLAANTTSSAITALGLNQTATLQQYATQAGIPLDGTVNIQPAIDAAHAAMAVVAAQPGTSQTGLFVKIPAGVYTCNNLKLYNRCGFFCDPGTVVLNMNVTNNAVPGAFVTLADPYATGYVFSGFLLDGGWNYARAPYAAAPETDPWLFQYPATITDNSTPDTGAQLGQCAIKIVSAYSGVSDSTYYYNSAVNTQLPRGRIEKIGAYNFGGDLFNFQGAGSNMLSDLVGQNCGGRGFTINGYDCNINNVDVGQTGLEAFNVGPNGSSLRLITMKGWYNGGRSIAGHQACLRVDRAAGTTFIGQLQDSYGEIVLLSGCSKCQVTISGSGWQSLNPTLTDATLIEMDGNCIGNQINATFDIQNSPSNGLRILRTKNTDGYWPTSNQLNITHVGMPNDLGIWNDFWYVGNLDNNILNVNDQTRNVKQYVTGDSGQYSLSTGTPTQIILYGQDASYGASGRILVISSGSYGGQVDHFFSTSATSKAILTSNANYVNGDTFVVGPTTYTMQSNLVNTSAYNIHIGATEAATITNITNAILGTGGTRGTDYSFPTIPNSQISTVTNDGAHVITINNIYAGAFTNGTPATANCAHASFNATTFTGGVDGSPNWPQAFCWGGIGLNIAFTGIAGNSAFANGETVTQGLIGSGTVISSNSTMLIINQNTLNGMIVPTANTATKITGVTSNATANVTSVTPTAGFAFGGGSPVVHPIASANQAAVSIVTSQTATATYGVNEQSMLNNLKADVNALAALVNALRAAGILDNHIKGSA